MLLLFNIPCEAINLARSPDHHRLRWTRRTKILKHHHFYDNEKQKELQHFSWLLSSDQASEIKETVIRIEEIN